jgi:DHA3 family tetracycline resistance protein-like MFS transporter
MIVSDILRALAIGVMAALSIAGEIELWHVIALVAVYGVGEAFFGPAHGAIVPDIVPSHLLVEANSLAQFINPLALRLIGPAVGGLAIAGLGAGGALLVDAGSFLVSAAAFALMRAYPSGRGRDVSVRTAVADMREGFRFVRSHVWLWGTLLGASIALLAFWGPMEVLVPYIVKNVLSGNAQDLGFVFAAGGIGAILAAVVLGQRGLPRRHVTFMYVCWSLSVLAIAGFGVATELWHAMVVSFVDAALGTAGLIVWATMMGKLVPTGLRGRVESVDWLVSVGLVPVSFALTGPLAAVFGAQDTLIGAGATGAVLTAAFLFLPGMRDTERDGALERAQAADDAISTANSVN